MLKFTSVVGYTSCGPTYIESFLTIFGQCINVLNYKYIYIYIVMSENINTEIESKKKQYKYKNAPLHLSDLSADRCCPEILHPSSSSPPSPPDLQFPLSDRLSGLSHEVSLDRRGRARDGS